MSLLLMFYRLFGIEHKFRIALYVAGALTIVWFLACFFDTVFECTPVLASWNKMIPNTKCQSIEKAALATGIKQSFTGLLVPCIAHPDDMEPPDAEEDKGIADRYLHAGNIVSIRACPRDRC